MTDSLFSLASVFTETGLVLWERFHTESGSSEEQARDAINELIQNVLLQERSVESNKYVSERGHQDVRFVRDNQCGSSLVFALVIASTLANVGKVSSMMERLIEAFRTHFVAQFRSQISENCDYNSEFKLFDDTWLRLQDDLQQTRSEKGPRAFEKKEKSKVADDSSKQSEGKLEESLDSSAASFSADAAASAVGDEASEEEKIERARAKLALKSKGSAASTKPLVAKGSGTPPQKKKSWKDHAGMGNPSSAKLDFSVGSEPAEEKLDDSKFTFNLAIDESSDEDDDAATSMGSASSRYQHGGKSSGAAAAAAAAAEAPGKKGWWQSIMTMTGNTAVDAADIAPALQQFRDMLISKNVAADIAENITTAVCDSLVGKKISGIHGIKAAAKDAMEEALTKILTPKQSIDILSEILLEKQRGNPYIICFVGVNGVGKSTTLAKVLQPLCCSLFSGIIRLLATYQPH
jgi:signal recognition particle receptor subunit alpha